MKKIIAIIAVIVTAVFGMGVFAGCGAKDVITVGYTVVDPLNYNDADGKLVGFDTELAEKVFGDLGYRVVFKKIEWPQKYTELNGGNIQCIWNGFTSNSSDNGTPRNQLVDFSYNYMTNVQCVVRLDTTEQVAELSDLTGKTVAYEQGSSGDALVNTLNTDPDSPVFSAKKKTSQMDAILEVKSGTAEYVVCDAVLAKSVAGKGDFANVVVDDIPVEGTEYYAIGFKKGSDLTAKVNAELEKLAESGFIADLAAKYGLTDQVITDFTSQKAQ